MIELYTWGTPNGRKISIMLEECGLPYRAHKSVRGKYKAQEWLMFQMGGVGPR